METNSTKTVQALEKWGGGGGGGGVKMEWGGGGGIQFSWIIDTYAHDVDGC